MANLQKWREGPKAKETRYFIFRRSRTTIYLGSESNIIALKAFPVHQKLFDDLFNYLRTSDKYKIFFYEVIYLNLYIIIGDIKEKRRKASIDFASLAGY